METKKRISKPTKPKSSQNKALTADKRPVKLDLDFPDVENIPIRHPVTVIHATVDVGFGNHLYIRGQGSSLSWEKGIPLTCINSKTWRWSAPIGEKISYKLLINDQLWSQGDNFTATPGLHAEIAPKF